MSDVVEYNRRARDGFVDRGGRWTVPVSSETIVFDVTSPRPGMRDADRAKSEPASS